MILSFRLWLCRAAPIASLRLSASASSDSQRRNRLLPVLNNRLGNSPSVRGKMGSAKGQPADAARNTRFPQTAAPQRSVPSLQRNTFATIGRELALAVFSDLPPARKREVSSAIAHYIAGVLDRGAMIEAVESLSETANWKPGDRVKTLRGSLRGKILRVLDYGRIIWQPAGTKSELTALPESLCADEKGQMPS
jgi:hypothetical protein